MKTLSVRQPWAQLLINGAKTIETRTWKTSYRGRLGIHAGLQTDHLGPWYKFAHDVVLPLGALVGSVELVDCRPMTKADEDAALCDWREGLFAWVVAVPARRDAIPMKGRLGLWDLSDELE